MELGVETVDARTRRPTSGRRELYSNRELSWLDFNERVLELAEDESMPLLERVKFLAIYASNLDEFFMVRVAGLHDQVDAGIDDRKADGLSASETIEQVARAGSASSGGASRASGRTRIRPALAEHGIRVMDLARVRRRRARGRRPALPRADLPRAHAARGRARAAVPVHLEPLAVHRGLAARPGDGDGAVRAREGAEGGAAAASSRSARTTFVPLEAVIARHLERALPRHGDRAPRLLPRHARRRLHGLRRGRRPAARGGGRAAPAALRRGRCGSRWAPTWTATCASS